MVEKAGAFTYAFCNRVMRFRFDRTLSSSLEGRLTLLSNDLKVALLRYRSTLTRINLHSVLATSIVKEFLGSQVPYL